VYAISLYFNITFWGLNLQTKARSKHNNFNRLVIFQYPYIVYTRGSHCDKNCLVYTWYYSRDEAVGYPQAQVTYVRLNETGHVVRGTATC
jgi:hypothetical protein